MKKKINRLNNIVHLGLKKRNKQSVKTSDCCTMWRELHFHWRRAPARIRSESARVTCAGHVIARATLSGREGRPCPITAAQQRSLWSTVALETTWQQYNIRRHTVMYLHGQSLPTGSLIKTVPPVRTRLSTFTFTFYLIAFLCGLSLRRGTFCSG